MTDRAASCEKDRVVVLGAGVCGLYAALDLATAGVPVTLLERESVPGGLAAGFRRGENFYDLGVHMLHGFDEAILDRVRSLMGAASVPVKLNAKIRWSGKDFRYPLQFRDMLGGVPLLELVRGIAGLLTAETRRRLKQVEPSNAEEALIQLYGRPLYEFFFRDFTRRYWGTPPSKLSAAFVKTKMPRLSVRDVVLNAMRKVGIRAGRDFGLPSALAMETLYYSRSGAEAMPRILAQAITNAGGEVMLGHEVKRVEAKNREAYCVTAVDTSGRTCRRGAAHCLSTLPLPHLIGLLSPEPPATVLNAVRRLRFRPIVVYGLLVHKPRALDALYVYFRNRMFHRIGEPKNAGMEVRPSDHTVLIVEMTCDEGDGKWSGDNESYRRLLAELEEEDICTPDQISECHVIQCREAYPIFELGFEPYLETLKNYLESLGGITSTGRQGGFCYPNMHGAMRMGADAAARILGESNFAKKADAGSDQAPGISQGRTANG